MIEKQKTLFGEIIEIKRKSARSTTIDLDDPDYQDDDYRDDYDNGDKK